MSRFNIKWKPQGAIPRDIGLTVKMQKLPERPKECPECPPAGCASPPLMAVWYGGLAGSEINYSMNTWEGTGNNAAIGILTAKLIRADGQPGETWIDANAITWQVEVEQLGGSDFYLEVAQNDPYPMLVLSLWINPAPCPQALVGRITVTPIYQGAALNVLTANVTAFQQFCW